VAAGPRNTPADDHHGVPGLRVTLGQMSFWGATVITSLASAVPLVGWTVPSRWQVVFWLWGGFAVDNVTVLRFYSFHYTLPFVLAGLALLHLVMLHR